MGNGLENELAARWVSVAGSSPEAEAVGSGLLRRWAEPHRRYHTLRHLEAVLRHLDEIGRPDHLVVYAAWYHDAVYEVGREDNEAASAALAEADLPVLGMAQGEVREVARLVMSTKDHRVGSGDERGGMLGDADLAVLGSREDDYEAYRDAVRGEYSALDDDAWRAGRATVIEGLLGRARIFSTGLGFRLWEEAARANLQKELSTLVSQGHSDDL